MKNIIRYIMIAFVALSTTFCSEPLEEKLFNDPSLTEFYQSEAEAQLALGGIYAVFWTSQGIYKDGANVKQNEQTTDLIQSYNSSEVWDLFGWSSSEDDLSKMWEGSYLAINRANTLIDRLEVSSVSQDVKDEYIGKGKFLRALHYFNMVRAFGGVPLHINATLDVSEVYKARSSETDVYAQIIADLKDAETKIGSFDAADQAAGDITLGAVKGLLAKVYLQQKDWTNAASKAKEVMDMGVYELYKNYADIWRVDMENGSEHLFSVQHGSEGGDGNNNIGNHTPSRVFFPRATKLPDGTDVKFKDSGNPERYVRQDFFDATPDTHRKWWSMRDMMPYYWIGTQRYEGNVDLDRAAIVKFYFPNDAATLDLGVNVTVQRYSDVLLIFAEATNEASASGPTTAAYDAVNEVRRRARAVGTEFEQDASVYPDLSGLTKDAFRDAVLLERAREFVGEGDRRNDLIRHGRFVSNAVDRGVNANANNVLFPIPLFHMNQNDLLTPNP
ncbi:RagB/SusD family nutrient uptake outer membrane protein [Reichenbachiella sp. MALMAid0571]|uniref:RagB/SusD family nutrient uptake outer membrane protein n=1 Tax=Reichenbachiella sp. MALMAid0571 TaxID=3143939 RepID=UPI0032DFB1AE